MKIDWNRLLDILAHVGAIVGFLIIWCSFIAAVFGSQLTFWSMAKDDFGWGLLAFACILVCGFAALPMWQIQKKLFRFFTDR